jgi:hypothetical protein
VIQAPWTPRSREVFSLPTSACQAPTATCEEPDILLAQYAKGRRYSQLASENDRRGYSAKSGLFAALHFSKILILQGKTVKLRLRI